MLPRRLSACFYVIGLLVGASLAAAPPARAQTRSAARAEADAAALVAELGAAQRAMVVSFVTGDSARVAARWCPEYQASGPRSWQAVARDSILRQYAARSHASGPLHRFTPPPADDSGWVLVRVTSDTTAAVLGRFWQEHVGAGGHPPIQVVVAHDFRRRAGGWCAVRGRTMSMAEALR